MYILLSGSAWLAKLMTVYRIIARTVVTARAEIFRVVLPDMRMHLSLASGIVTQTTHSCMCSSFYGFICLARQPSLQWIPLSTISGVYNFVLYHIHDVDLIRLLLVITKVEANYVCCLASRLGGFSYLASWRLSVKCPLPPCKQVVERGSLISCKQVFLQQV